MASEHHLCPPLRYDYAIRALGAVCSNPEEVVEGLARRGLVVKVQHMGAVYLLRNFRTLAPQGML